MFIAIDKNKNRIDIISANSDCTYYCPICNQELVQRRGNTNIHHFAHKKNTLIQCDDWNSDMTAWHRNWQKRFPENNREIVIEYCGKKHRADVLINNTVVEFQHSKLSYEEFEERNMFYTSAGYNLVWLFDMEDDFNSDRIYNRYIEFNNYCWKYHWHTFDKFNPEISDKVCLYFQFNNQFNDNKSIERISWFSSDRKKFSVDNKKLNVSEFIDFVSNYKKTNNRVGKPLLELLINSNSHVIGVVNINTGVCAKIGNSGYFKRNNIYKIYGYLGKKNGEKGYYSDRREIFRWDYPEWSIVWEY